LNRRCAPTSWLPPTIVHSRRAGVLADRASAGAGHGTRGKLALVCNAPMVMTAAVARAFSLDHGDKSGTQVF
jgi:hypothetical protein